MHHMQYLNRIKTIIQHTIKRIHHIFFTIQFNATGKQRKPVFTVQFYFNFTPFGWGFSRKRDTELRESRIRESGTTISIYSPGHGRLSATDVAPLTMVVLCMGCSICGRDTEYQMRSRHVCEMTFWLANIDVLRVVFVSCCL